MKKFQVKEVYDWYDGLVEGIVEDDGGAFFYASLIAFNPDERLRVYAAVALEAPYLERFQELTSEVVGPGMAQSWQRIRRLVSDFLNSPLPSQVLLVQCADLDGTDQRLRMVESGDVREFLGNGVEEAVDPARWVRFYSDPD